MFKIFWQFKVSMVTSDSSDFIRILLTWMSKMGFLSTAIPKIRISLLFPRLVLTSLNISFSLLLLRTQGLIFCHFGTQYQFQKSFHYYPKVFSRHSYDIFVALPYALSYVWGMCKRKSLTENNLGTPPHPIKMKTGLIAYISYINHILAYHFKVLILYLNMDH